MLKIGQLSAGIKIYRISLFLLVFLILLWLRTDGLGNAAVFDYDSAKNMLIAQEMTKGNFSNVLFKSSPFIHLLNTGLLAIFKDWRAISYGMAIIALLGCWLIAAKAAKIFSWSYNEFLLAFLFLGSAAYAVTLSRYQSLPPLSLGLFGLFFLLYPLKGEFGKNGNWSMVVLALLWVTNYKVALVFPFLLLNEYRLRRHSYRSVLLIMLMVGLVFILFSTLSLFSGQSFFFLAKSMLARYFFRAPNPLIDNQSLSLDLDFYFRWLLHFENPLTLILLILAGFKLRKSTFLPLYIFTVGLFIIMHFLPKAPRGVLWCYPFFYVFSFEALRRLRIRYLPLIIVLASFAYSIYLLQRDVYAYSYDLSSGIANVIKNKETKIISTLGLRNQIPLENKIIDFVFDEKSFYNGLESHHYEYAIYDWSHYASGLPLIDRKKLLGKPLAKYRCGAILMPIHILENAEYAGLSFDECMQRWKTLKDQDFQIEVYEP